LSRGKESTLKSPKKSKQSPTQASASEEEPYEPTPNEREALAAFKAVKRSPRLKVTNGRDGDAKVGIDHPHLGYGQIALMNAIGTTSGDFLEGLILQLVNASKEKTPSEKGANFMLAVIKGIEPRDQIEAMLAAQMAAVHMASMTFARRLAHVDNIPQQDSAERAFNKLTRTFAAQVSALKEYRSKGEQKMTVQHVHVGDGGQAIVGNVNAPTEGGGPREKTGEQRHALGYAPGLEMPCEVEAERVPMPSAGGEGD
jgi:hypothetical protein